MEVATHIVCPRCDAVNRIAAERSPDQAKCGKCRAALFDGQPVELTQARFSRHIGRNDVPVLVDFWAPWCGPCRMMAPAFVQAAGALQPEVRLAKVNTEQEQGLAMQYGIRSIPTLILFKRGQEAARVAGAMDLHNLVAWTRGQL